MKTTQDKLGRQKHLPNVISILRIAGSFSLLFCDVRGWPFWTLYVLCGLSDISDGWLARKLHAESKTGAALDSVSDLLFVACCAVRLLPVAAIATFAAAQEGHIIRIKLLVS